MCHGFPVFLAAMERDLGASRVGRCRPAFSSLADALALTGDVVAAAAARGHAERAVPAG